MNPILEKALEFLHTCSLNIEEPLSNPNDKDKAKTLFKILHAHGIPLNAEDIKNWGLSREGVSQRHAHALRSLAQQIAGGMQVVLFDQNNASAIPKDIVEILSQEIEGEGL